MIPQTFHGELVKQNLYDMSILIINFIAELTCKHPKSVYISSYQSLYCLNIMQEDTTQAHPPNHSNTNYPGSTPTIPFQHKKED